MLQQLCVGRRSAELTEKAGAQPGAPSRSPQTSWGYILTPLPALLQSPAATCKKPQSLLLSHPLWCCRHRHVGKHAQGCLSQPAKEQFKYWWLLNKLIMSEVKVFNIRAGRLPKSPSKNPQLDSAGAWSLHGLSTSWVKLGLELERRVASYNPSFSKTIHL